VEEVVLAALLTNGWASDGGLRNLLLELDRHDGQRKKVCILKGAGSLNKERYGEIILLRGEGAEGGRRWPVVMRLIWCERWMLLFLWRQTWSVVSCLG
jgi:hypothetical protein